MTSSGDLTRAETLFTYQKVRELMIANDAQSVLIDARDIEVVSTPEFAMEYVEAFVDILERPLPIAFIPPVGWSDDHYSAGWQMTQNVANETGVFKTPELALDWLEIKLGNCA